MALGANFDEIEGSLKTDSHASERSFQINKATPIFIAHGYAKN